MSQEQAVSRSRIEYRDVELLPENPSDATTIRVFRHVAAYYGQESHRAFAGLCLTLGDSMMRVATSLHAAAIVIERAALANVRLSAADLEVLHTAESAVQVLSTRLKHERLYECRRELERRRTTGGAPPRYLVAELEPTVWRIPFEMPCDDLAEAFEWFTSRAQLHVQMFGEPRPMILLDRETNTILRSASDAAPEPITMATDLSAWLDEG